MIRIPGKIPIAISPFFWVIAALIGYLSTYNVFYTVLWMLIILVSVLIHEYGHALTALAFGQNAQIELVAFGGLTHRHSGGRLSTWKEFLIVLNGPLAGLLLALAAFGVYANLSLIYPHSIVTYIFGITAMVNVFWTVVNLLPVQPLDGSKLLLIVLEGFFGLKGKKSALFFSFLFAVACCVFFFYIEQVLLGMLFVLFAFDSFRLWKGSLALRDQDDNFILQHLHKEALRDLKGGDKEDALSKFLRLRELAKSGVLYQTATESAAQLLAEKGDEETPYDMLIALGNKLSPDGLRLLHYLAFRKGEWKEVISVGDKAYHYFPDYDIATINALCHGILGEVRPAIGWLQCAIKEGLPNIEEVLASKEFDPIRKDPLFREFSLKE